jgi:hypothetical protein
LAGQLRQDRSVWTGGRRDDGQGMTAKNVGTIYYLKRIFRDFLQKLSLIYAICKNIFVSALHY